jgi:hypothetical protein
MELKYYPDKLTVQKAMDNDDPLLMMVKFDGSEILLSNIDDAMEHIVLLRKLNYNETSIDNFFRVVINKQGADWTFVCPSNYKGIKDRNRRIEIFYNDGIDEISKAVKLIGYKSTINIPDRYRRQFNFLSE